MKILLVENDERIADALAKALTFLSLFFYGWGLGMSKSNNCLSSIT